MTILFEKNVFGVAKKNFLYQIRKQLVVPRGGIEPPTQGFSVLRS